MFYMDLIFSLVCMLLLIICVLVGVAFLTLLERKVLGYIQIRKGPNKVGFMGIPQPFCDAIKLFSKEQTYPLLSNYIMYYYSPIMSLFLSLLLWVIIPYFLILFSFSLGMLFFLACTSLGVYTVMIAGWSSNSSYSLLGGLRAVAQTISYEVSLALILMSFMILIESFSLMEFMQYQKFVWMIFLSLPLGFVWFVSSLAETNRTPFDFAEGESELVSGFNVEYSSGGFALIFLSEYSSILFMSMLFCVMFLGSDLMSILFFLKVVFLAFSFIWVRGTLPRYRYDKLMYLAWKSFLPLSLNYLFLYMGLKMLYFSLLI
uniref:NADH dehydrogenase subunit 1 n=1 Tax=Dyscolus oreas TaxID=3027493 RepID=UPI0023D7BA98|nr:NADH dehydrogenase subunit 1 [Dyscolus oreas]YP_010710274.1 NADH dehydrogenase subunit 1 [Dyscolus diopsis]WCS91738.1 NADH dehydrogenase subunit 1 [Dyscolus rotundiceps]WCS91647.1 NADH dehydrogenase subunit 1 [Dyscolus oreas]WCS91660.1 NADH dehydrogenase subunit 1 [Dyscolus oreas]WCS91712.1 NADH dehydrogenase subunit 1 [Dyscolus diopsis]WCS91803.1 NADH dehydrogenase subunit 1 [Dyscolus diopsis]